MTSVSRSPRLSPEHFRNLLQGYFVRYLAKHPRFDSEVESLREKWNSAILSSYDASRLSAMDVTDLPRSVSEIDRYVMELEKVVAVEFRCQSEGQPAEWVCRAVHDVVRTGHGLVARTPEVDTSVVLGELVAVVTTSGSSWVGSKINLTPFYVPPDFDDELGDSPAEVSVEEMSPISLPAQGAFTDWKGLSAEAHLRLDEMLAQMKSRSDQATEGWDAVYEKGFRNRVESTLPLLISYLVDREQLFLGDRTAANNLRQELGLDSPSRVKKFRK